MKKLTLLLLIFTSIIACKKNKNDNPKPSKPSTTINNPVDTTDTTDTTDTSKPKLRFASTSVTLTSDGYDKSFELAVSGDNVKIVSVTSVSGNIDVSNDALHDGLNIKVTLPNKVYAGVDTISITISDDTDTISTYFIVNIGSESQIDTYNNLSKYFTQTFVSGFKIKEDGSMSGGSDADFYEISSENGPATYKILSNGNILVTAMTTQMEYSIQYLSSNKLGFTLIHTTNDSYNHAVGHQFMF
jgi:hypothetical protein